MHLSAALGLLTNISKVYNWGIKENGLSMRLKNYFQYQNLCFWNLGCRVTKIGHNFCSNIQLGNSKGI